MFDAGETLTDITVWLYKACPLLFFPHSAVQQMHRAVVTCLVTQREAKRLRASSLLAICILFCQWIRLQVQLANAAQPTCVKKSPFSERVILYPSFKCFLFMNNKSTSRHLRQ